MRAPLPLYRAEGRRQRPFLWRDVPLGIRCWPTSMRDLDTRSVPLVVGSLRVVAGPPDAEIGSVYDPLAGRQLSNGIKRRGAHGFVIECLGGRKEFDSKGLRCCSSECERAYRSSKDAVATMAEVGMEAAAKRRCEAPGCQHHIPNWRNGRRVSSAVKFCSPACRRKAAKNALMAPTGPDTLLGAETDFKPHRTGIFLALILVLTAFARLPETGERPRIATGAAPTHPHGVNQ
jgi:hypothetical protein